VLFFFFYIVACATPLCYLLLLLFSYIIQQSWGPEEVNCFVFFTVKNPPHHRRLFLLGSIYPHTQCLFLNISNTRENNNNNYYYYTHSSYKSLTSIFPLFFLTQKNRNSTFGLAPYKVKTTAAFADWKLSCIWRRSIDTLIEFSY
jgi:hypothetical protein